MMELWVIGGIGGMYSGLSEGGGVIGVGGY